MDKKIKKDTEDDVKAKDDAEYSEKDVEMKGDETESDEDDSNEKDIVKKESYQERDQPAVQDKEASEKEVPAGKVGDSKETPYSKPDVPAGKVGKSTGTPYTKNTAKLAKEAVEQMFEGAGDLSEDFMTKATTIFEAAFNSKLKEAVKDITESIQEEFDTKYSDLETTLSEKVDTYLDYAVTEWVEQNEVAVTESIKSEIAENFLTDFKELFEKHNITIPEQKIDLLEQANIELEAATAEVNSLTESIMEKNAIIFEASKDSVIAEISKDNNLAETKIEKLKALVEDIDAKDIETFEEKAKIICSSFLSGTTEQKDLSEGEEIVVVEGEALNEDSQQSFKVHPDINRYVASAKMYNPK